LILLPERFFVEPIALSILYSVGAGLQSYYLASIPGSKARAYQLRHAIRAPGDLAHWELSSIVLLAFPPLVSRLQTKRKEKDREPLVEHGWHAGCIEGHDRAGEIARLIRPTGSEIRRSFSTNHK
jgi:hypothetical protein